MKIRLLYISIAVVFLTLYNSCKKETSINSTNGLRKNPSKITYAKGFDIQYFTTYKKLIIKNLTLGRLESSEDFKAENEKNKPKTKKKILKLKL